MRLFATLAVMIGMLQSTTLTAQTASKAGSVTVPSGPSFRVETELFDGDAVQPSARHLILFDSGVIYDFRLDDDRQVTMYDPARGRVILIDRQHLEQTVLRTEDLLGAAARARAAIQQENRAEFFGLEAEVQALEPENPGDPVKYEVAFGDTRYLTTTQPVKNPEIAAAYNHFATLAAQLNVILKLGLPPFARLTLGQHIADRGHLPLSTTLELDLRRGLKKQRFRSQLLVIEQLSEMDRSRIVNLGQLLAQCQPVPLDQFQQ